VRTNKKTIRYRDRCLCLLLFLVIIWAFANAADAQERFVKTGKKNFLWTVANGDKGIYLLGAVHFLASESFPLADEIEKAYGDSKTVVFETDIDDFNDPAFQAKMVASGLIPEDRSLQQYVSKQTYSALKKKVERMGLQMELFDRFKPWLCALTLASLEVQELGLDPNYGIDSYYFNKAKKDRKQVLFLESIEDQLRLFTEMSRNQQEAFLKQTLEDLEIFKKKVSDLINAWTNGDADSLGSIVEVGFKDYPEIYEKMMVQRNKYWLSKIDHLIKQGDKVLVIVGAAHLVGKESLLKLLRNKGYEIEQR
jgi:uncharacterized protein YbaP (TraB family)